MNQEFRDIINEIRYKYGLNQSEIANRLGMSKSRLSDMMAGRVAFSENVRTTIQREFDLAYEQNSQEPGIPLIPVLARAGHLVDFSDAISEYDCEKIISPVGGAEIAVPIYGASMEPEFPSGSIVFVKRINEKAFIEWGKTYILDTVNGSVMKYLAPGEDGKIKCISSNPDPMYAPFEVSPSDVLGVYKVIMCMAMK